MASRYTEKNLIKCWNLLAEVLSYGHTIPFSYKKDPQQYCLSEGGGWVSYDYSTAQYLLDDIAFALLDEKLPKIILHLEGKDSGPICHFWKFTFTKKGLIEAYCYYNDD